MERSLFGTSSPHLEEDPWSSTSNSMPNLGQLSMNESHLWTTTLSDEDNDENNENNDRENFDDAGNGIPPAHENVMDDPLGLSRSEILEDAIIAKGSLSTNTTNMNSKKTKKTKPINYNNEDTDLLENIWDVELTNSYDTLGYQNSSNKAFIRVKEIPEKEGLVFKHINYLVTHNIKFAGEAGKSAATANTKNDVKIIRRYSDFFWIYEVLLKKYPFRAVPELPPKKFNGNTTSGDSFFLQNRRRGLQRFLNQLIKHPILGKENLVIMFLTVPNDFSNWKKFAKIDLSDEFEGVKFVLPLKYKLNFKTTPREEYEEEIEQDDTDHAHTNEQAFQNIEKIWEENDNDQRNFVANAHKLNQNLTKIIELWGKLTILVERFEKRQLAMVLDEQRFESILKNFLDNDNKVFQMDKLVDIHQQSQLYNFERDEAQNLNIINTILAKVGTYFASKRVHENEEVANINTRHLENFKKFQDYLIAFNEVLERLILFKVTSEKSNAAIVSRIMKANEKLQLWLRKPDIKGSDFDKLNNYISLQVLELNKNLYKILLVKNCIKLEYKLFSKLKYLLTEMFQEWFTDKNKYGQIYDDLLEKCLSELQELPLA